QQSLSEVRNHLQTISGWSDQFESLLQRLESARLELEDITSELEKHETRVDFDPERAEYVKERLSTIYQLLKKHRLNDVSELLTLQAQLEEKSFVVGNLDEALARSKKEYENAEKRVTSSSTSLRESRKKVFQPL